MHRVVIVPADEQKALQQGQEGPYLPVVLIGRKAKGDAAGAGDGVHVIQGYMQAAGDSGDDGAGERHVQADHRRQGHGFSSRRFVNCRRPCRALRPAAEPEEGKPLVISSNARAGCRRRGIATDRHWLPGPY